MKLNKEQVAIRRFQDDDAECCFKIRADAFQSKFIDEIGKEAVIAGVKAFQPYDYKQIAEKTEFFIIDLDQQPAGFFIIKRHSLKTAELVLIYVDLQLHGKGLGGICCSFIDDWIKQNWNEVEKIYVDTIIPKYNSGFYQKRGYIQTEIVSCEFPGKSVPAVRLEKIYKGVKSAFDSTS